MWSRNFFTPVVASVAWATSRLTLTSYDVNGGVQARRVIDT